MQRVLEAPEFDESTGEVECGGNCDTATGFSKKLKSGLQQGILKEGLAEVFFFANEAMRAKHAVHLFEDDFPAVKLERNRKFLDT